MIRCYIIDDERPAIRVIENYLKRISNVELVGTSTNPLIGIEEINKNQIDVVFLDIQMDEMNGIEVVGYLNSSIKVVYCTAYSEFAVKSYELNVVDYLMKPISFERFEKAILKLTDSYSIEKEISNDYLFVKTGQRGNMVKINFEDIEYIEGRSNYIAYHAINKIILTHSTLKEVETILPSNIFMRVHKSYIVSLKKIAAIENNEIKLIGNTSRIPVSISYKNILLSKLAKG